MRINDNSNLANNALGQTGRAAETESTGSSARSVAKAAPSETDDLQLSRFAGALSQVIQTDSASRSQRVAQLAATVQSGSYQVDSLATSRAIVDYSIAAA
jgi:anti-sigma28 factor (negative regulator of flagellin synthesis)